MRVAVDIGGTFTDLVAVDPAGGVTLAKAPSTPPDFERGVVDALERSGLDPTAIRSFVHGTTVVINAITERTGAPTGLITTAGFRDVLEIGRANRPDLYNYRYRKPAPFVPRHLRLEVRERLDPSGAVVQPLDEADVRRAAETLAREGVRAVAVCFLHGYANPAHELRCGEILADLLPGVAVTLSHTVTREWREYERSSTAVLNAYVAPVAGRYLGALEAGLDAAGATRSRRYLMQSSGGIATFAQGRRTPIALLESGPVGGVIGTAALGRAMGEPNLVTLDIGGTTVKCCLIHEGRLPVTTDHAVERTPWSPGYPVKVPVVDIVELGAGGGSIAWRDPTGALRVGPRSAGADPGPACYGRGGREPTLTDAHLLCGRLDPGYFLGGRMSLHPELARAALAPLAEALGAGVREAARGVLRIGEAHMANALGLVSVRRGHDPRQFSLVAFGGAGPLHAASLAEQLRLKQVIVPRAPAHFSAWGMLATDLRVDRVLTRVTPTATLDPDDLEAAFAALEREAFELLADQGVAPERISGWREADLRYAGQEHTVRVTVPAPLRARDDLARLEAAFHEAHGRRYAFTLPEGRVEVVNLHAVGVGASDRLSPAKLRGAPDPGGPALKGERRVDFEAAGELPCPVYERDRLAPGTVIEGPALVEEPAAVTLVPPGWRLMVDGWGNLVLTAAPGVASGGPPAAGAGVEEVRP